MYSRVNLHASTIDQGQSLACHGTEDRVDSSAVIALVLVSHTDAHHGAVVSLFSLLVRRICLGDLSLVHAEVIQDLG